MLAVFAVVHEERQNLQDKITREAGNVRAILALFMLLLFANTQCDILFMLCAWRPE